MWLQEQSILFTVWRTEWPCAIDCATIRIVAYVRCDCAVSRDRPMVSVTCAVLEQCSQECLCPERFSVSAVGNFSA